jgi:hypothetical protein
LSPVSTRSRVEILANVVGGPPRSLITPNDPAEVPATTARPVKSRAIADATSEPPKLTSTAAPPSFPYELSRLPSELYRTTAKSVKKLLELLDVPTTKILPSVWIATPVPGAASGSISFP